ncbi:MAG: formyl-CoA transferase [Candidatus Azotimanducaceae bacterium]|jgi:formyl-CoA transferase
MGSNHVSEFTFDIAAKIHYLPNQTHRTRTMKKTDFYRNARTDIPGPLSGIRVLEATTTWAGPMCAAVLADFGADVIKVEIPSGDVSRAVQPFLPGTEVSSMHGIVNRNKRALSVDVRTEQGRDIFLKLAASADIIVENFKVGTMAGYGLGYEQLCALKPDIVYVSITGWGQFGPNHEAAGYDPLAQAASGFMSVNGSPDGPPTKAATYLADDLGGLHGALGAMAALRHRDQTGEGQHVDVALQDALLFQSNGMPTLGAMGAEPERMGNEFGAAVPSNVYECLDGSVFAGILLDKHWHALAPIIGEPDLADHESFATRNERIMNRELCNIMLGNWLATRTREEAISIFREAGLPIAPVNSYQDVAKDPHVLERDMLQQIKLKGGGTAPITGPAVKFSRTPTRVRTCAPEIGEHNAEILESIGLDTEAQLALSASGIIS